MRAENDYIAAHAERKNDYNSARRALFSILNLAETIAEKPRTTVPPPTREELARAWDDLQRQARTELHHWEIGTLRDRYETALAQAR